MNACPYAAISPCPHEDVQEAIDAVDIEEWDAYFIPPAHQAVANYGYDYEEEGNDQLAAANNYEEEGNDQLAAANNYEEEGNDQLAAANNIMPGVDEWDAIEDEDEDDDGGYDSSGDFVAETDDDDENEDINPIPEWDFESLFTVGRCPLIGDKFQCLWCGEEKIECLDYISACDENARVLYCRNEDCKYYNTAVYYIKLDVVFLGMGYGSEYEYYY